MDLSGARLEHSSGTYPVAEGWVERLDEARSEVKGWFVLATSRPLPRGFLGLILVAEGVPFTIQLMRQKGQDAIGRARWRFIASCVPETVRGRLVRNPHPSRGVPTDSR